jgi:hypothetical protein
MKIEFEFETLYGKYNDTIYLPDDHTYTKEQIIEMQTERVNRWICIIENPPVPEPEFVEIQGIKYEKIVFEGQPYLKQVEV